MDIAIEPYRHLTHFWGTAPLFQGYILEVNDEIWPPIAIDGWVRGLPGSIKIVRDLQANDILGFMCYRFIDDTTLWAEALYIKPEMRYNGLTRALLASFPRVKLVRFILHKSRSEGATNPMMLGLANARYVGEGPNPRLELWEFDLDHSKEFGASPAMEEIRKEAI